MLKLTPAQVASPPSCLTFNLPGQFIACPSWLTPSCLVPMLPHTKVASFPSCLNTTLYHTQVASSPSCLMPKLPHYYIASPPSCLTVKLPHPRVTYPSSCLMPMLSHPQKTLCPSCLTPICPMPMMPHPYSTSFPSCLICFSLVPMLPHSKVASCRIMVLAQFLLSCKTPPVYNCISKMRKFSLNSTKPNNSCCPLCFLLASTVSIILVC